MILFLGLFGASDCDDVISLARGLKMDISYPSGPDIEFNRIVSNCCTANIITVLKEALGVFCTNGNVTLINWTSRGLTGFINVTAIPKNLETLNLRYNQIQGNFPSKFPASLKSIDLSNTPLAIPYNLSNYTDLKSISLINSNINKTLPILPPNLEELRVSADLVGIDNVTTFNNLKKLYLKGIPTNKTYPKFPPNLNSLSLFSQEAAIKSPDLMYLIDLKVLVMDYCLFIDGWPNLPLSIENVTINDNYYASGPIPDLSHLTRLRSIFIEESPYRGPFMGFPKSLESLQLINTHYFVGPLPPLVSTNLSYISLYYNRALNGPLPTLPASIKTVEINNNLLNGTLPDFTNNTALTVLSLRENKFSGNLTKLPNSLKSLDLGGNSFTGPIDELPKSLITLRLTLNRFTGKLPNFLTFTNLTSLVLDSNLFEGTLPSFPTGLFLLTVSNNLLEGTIDVIKPLNNMYYLYLDNNRFSGAIPDLRLSPFIQQISLKQNNFSASIFPNISNTLQNFYISNCNIIGSLPDLSLTSIRELDISYNQISSFTKLPPYLYNFKANDNALNISLPSFPATLSMIELQNNNVTGSLNLTSPYKIDIRNTQISDINIVDKNGLSICSFDNSLISKNNSNVATLQRCFAPEIVNLVFSSTLRATTQSSSTLKYVSARKVAKVTVTRRSNFSRVEPNLFVDIWTLFRLFKLMINGALLMALAYYFYDKKYGKKTPQRTSMLKPDTFLSELTQ